MKGTSSLSLSQEQSEYVPSSSQILKHQSFQLGLLQSLWGALSGVPLLLIVASSKCVIPLSPLPYSGNESKAELLTGSSLFLSLDSLRWAEVCLG